MASLGTRIDVGQSVGAHSTRQEEALMRSCSSLLLSALFTAYAASDVDAVGQYLLTHLGEPNNNTRIVYGNDINSRGQVVGVAVSATGFFSQGYVWTPDTPNGTTGSMTPIAPNIANAIGINDYGQVVGGAYVWTPNLPNGITGSIVSLRGDDPTMPSTLALSINSNGQFAGFLGSDDGRRKATLGNPSTPNGATFSQVYLGDLPGGDESSLAKDINAFGQVVGWSVVESETHGFLWTPDLPNGTVGTMTDLGELPGGGNLTDAHAINSYGQVVGESNKSTGLANAFLWSPTTPNGTNGSMIELGALPGGSGRSVAYGINSQGHIVGGSSIGVGSHAFLWMPTTPNATTGSMVDLNSLIDPVTGAGWTLAGAHAINDAGQIVGNGYYDPDGPGGLQESGRAFLLTPVPEPSTLVIGTIVAVFFGCIAHPTASVRSENN